MSALWDDILNAAVVGTGRAAEPPAPPGLVLSGTSEERVLDALAVLSTLRVAARPLRSDGFEPMAEMSSHFVSRDCNVQAGRVLGDILANAKSSDTPLLLREWCRRAVAAGVEVPPSMRAAVRLRLGADDLFDLDAAFGLVDFNELTARTRNRQEAWENGTPPKRAAAFREWRRADPAEARAALHDGWASESPAVRTALVEAMETGLSVEDEPFLELVMDERNKGLNSAIREILSRIEGSAFERRAEERARAAIDVVDGRIRVVLPPPGSDAWHAWKRDLGRMPSEAVEREACTMIARAPLRAWWDRAPMEWLRAAAKEGYSVGYVQAWAAARADSSAHGREFAVERMRFSVEHLPGRYGMPSNWSGIRDDEADALLCDLFALRKVHEQFASLQEAPTACPLLAEYDRPWSIRLSRAVVEWLGGYAYDPADTVNVAGHLRQYAHGDILPELRIAATKARSRRDIESSIGDAITFLEFRIRMDAAFAVTQQESK